MPYSVTEDLEAVEAFLRQHYNQWFYLDTLEPVPDDAWTIGTPRNGVVVLARPSLFIESVAPSTTYAADLLYKGRGPVIKGVPLGESLFECLAWLLLRRQIEGALDRHMLVNEVLLGIKPPSDE